MEERLIYNAIKTPDGTILHSKHQHDFVTHVDENSKTYGIDGGNSYRRLIGDHQDCEDLSLYDNGKHETRRTYLHWGRNYDENMVKLSNTEWIPIKDMSTGHIEAILNGGWTSEGSYYNGIFKEELKFRKDDQGN